MTSAVCEADVVGYVGGVALSAADERPRGCTVPRIFTPPARELTPQTTHGYSVIWFAENVLGLTLLPWQKWLFLHALELRPDGTYRFRTVIVLVARQNGKTMMMLVLALWSIYVQGLRTVIGTAQKLEKAEETWAEAVEMARAEPDLSESIAKVEEQKGRKSLQLLPDEDAPPGASGPEYKVAAANRRGGRGSSGDRVLLDELREHQSWDAWASLSKTTLARPKAQVWTFSNAGDALSIVLRYLRALAHESVGWPDGDGDKAALDAHGATGDAEADADFAQWEDEFDDESLALFEWSAAPTARRGDPQVWAQANPSMNYDDFVPNCITVRAIAAAFKTDPPSLFDTEVLCRWLATATGGPFPPGKWGDSLDESSVPNESARRTLCVEVSLSRSTSYVALAGTRADGLAHCEIQESGDGTDWVVPWLIERRAKYAAVVVRKSGAQASSLLDQIRSATLPNGEPANLPVLECSGADLGRAMGIAYDAVDNGTVKHLPHPGLDLAASTAAVKTTTGGGWEIDPVNSPTDPAPLVAWIGALWALGVPEKVRKIPQIHLWPDELEEIAP